jgi:hypothetical protein
MKSKRRKSRKPEVPKSREGCVIHPDGRISDAEFHEPILSGISKEAEARIREMDREIARRAGLSQDEIEILYG